MRKHWWICAVVVLLAFWVRWPLLNLEFGRNGDGTGSFYGIIARNYLLRDNGPTLWMPVISVGLKDSIPTLYAHHPPTVPLTLALSFALFGDSDRAARLPALIFTLASVAAMFGLLWPRMGALAATCGATLMAFVPIGLRFGQMPDVVNSQLAFAGLLVIWAYLRVVERPTEIMRGVALGGALVFAFMTDWPAFFLVPVLLAHLLFTRPGSGGIGEWGWGSGARSRRWAWLAHGATLGSLALLCFGGLYIWISVATGDWGLIPRQFFNRATQAKLDNHAGFSWGSWVAGVWAYNRSLHTWPLLLWAALGCVAVAFSGGKKQVRLVVALPVAWAVVHVGVGRQGVLNHDWWWWPVTPALCIAAAGLVSVFWTHAVQRWGGRRRESLPLLWIPAVCLTITSAFCAVWARTEVRNLLSPKWTYDGIPAYTAKELGQAVQQVTPVGRAAMLFEHDEQPYLVYYCNRPILQQVWDPETFDRRRTSNGADLFYSFQQHIDSPPATYVFPKAYLDKGGTLLAYLRARHPERDLGKFLSFDLTTSLAADTATGQPRP